MSKKTLVTVLGVLIIALPFIGLPTSISTPIYVLTGVGIIYIARVGKRKVDAQR